MYYPPISWPVASKLLPLSLSSLAILQAAWEVQDVATSATSYRSMFPVPLGSYHFAWSGRKPIHMSVTLGKTSISKQKWVRRIKQHRNIIITYVYIYTYILINYIMNIHELWFLQDTPLKIWSLDHGRVWLWITEIATWGSRALRGLGVFDPSHLGDLQKRLGANFGRW